MGEEHRNLCCGELSQFSLGIDSNGIEYLQYTQNIQAKNAQGGLDHIHVQGKQVRAYAGINPDRCIVSLYKKYQLVCPKPRPNAFYLRPLQQPKSTEHGEVWFYNQAVGRNTLSQVVSKICKNAGIGGFRTNHSLRTSAACRLYEQGIEEQLIQEQTGHRSNAVRGYKRTTDAMKRKISAMISGEHENCKKPKSVTFDPKISNDDKKLSVTLNFNI